MILMKRYHQYINLACWPHLRCNYLTLRLRSDDKTPVIILLVSESKNRKQSDFLFSVSGPQLIVEQLANCLENGQVIEPLNSVFKTTTWPTCTLFRFG